jgi:PPOX class probable F420-dependent enzyme
MLASSPVSIFIGLARPGPAGVSFMIQATSPVMALARIVAPHFHRHIILTTFRQNGMPESAVVWFAAAKGKLYIRTLAHSGNVQRIKHTPRVLVAPASISGQQCGLTVVGQAHIVPQFEGHVAERALDDKYGLWGVVTRLRGSFGTLDDQSILIEITLDPGPGTADLLLEQMPESQRMREIGRNIAIGTTTALAVGGLVVLLRRLSSR